jgi:hypothetical protein
MDSLINAGRALGNTPFDQTVDTINTKMESLYNDLSAGQLRTVDLRSADSFVPHMLSFQTRRYSYNPGSSMSYNFSGYTSVPPTEGRMLNYRIYAKNKDYGAKWQRRKKFETFGETKSMKNAIKGKFLSMTTVPVDGYSYDTAAGATTHTKQSLAYMMGANWQVRKLAKKSKIVPEFKAGNFVPFSNANPLHSGGVGSVSKGYRAHGVFTASQFQDQVADMRKNSIAANIGLTAPKVAAGKAVAPKIVLKTSDKSVSDWQKKIDADWTHDGFGWARGSVTVNKVYDVMYHDYYGDYKQEESSKGNVMYGYHGTDFEAGSKIIKGGFIVPRSAKAGRMLGDGVYIAKSSSKSSQYLHSKSFSRHGNTGVLLVNRIAAGKTNADGLDPSGARYDSSLDTVYAKGQSGGNTNSYLDHDEWCVRNPKAVVPIQWIEVSSH